MATMPSIDEWLREAKQDPGFRNCGMYLVHNGTVRETPKAKARGIETDGVAAGEKVGGMHFDYDEQRVQAAVEETRALPGMIDALQSLVGTIKNECVSEVEKPA